MVHTLTDDGFDEEYPTTTRNIATTRRMLLPPLQPLRQLYSMRSDKLIVMLRRDSWVVSTSPSLPFWDGMH